MAVTRANQSAGLRILHTQPTTCFAHATPEPLAIHTWGIGT